MSKVIIKKLLDAFKKYFFAGFLILVPIGATFTILKWILNIGNTIFIPKNGKVLFFIPEYFIPDVIKYQKIPGVGFVFLITIILLIGVLTTNIFGKRLLNLGNELIQKIPFVRKIYSTVKQITETLFMAEKSGFKRVVLVEYPRDGLYAIGFLTGKALNEINRKNNKKFVNVFIPTSPNPTSGFLFIVPEEDVVHLDISVEAAFKMIISGGIISSDYAKKDS